MKIVEIKEVYDCIDKPSTKEIIFDKPVDINFIIYLAGYGNLRYFPEFPKPFYQINIPEILNLKGVENNNSVQLIIHQENIDSTINFFKTIVDDYDNSELKGVA